MANMNEDLPEPQRYTKSYAGVYGNFGAGANAQVRFIQTVIRIQDLSDIRLISTIPGSETWDVADLFQRDVDDDRVQNKIKPYLENVDKIKFFNPLTLLVLPMADDNRAVLSELSSLEIRSESNSNQILESPGLYQFRMRTPNDHYAELRWDPSRCHLVAIDGQHRVSALKRIAAMPNPKVDIASWRVPVVILTIAKHEAAIPSRRLLELVRNTFVYINTTAVEITKARKILLNDESPISITTQQFVQRCHRNDNQPYRERNNVILPLLLLDWRGETKNGIRVLSPAALKDIEEISYWFESYILGEDFEDRQREELAISDMIPALRTYGANLTLSSEDAERLRKCIDTIIIPSVSKILENFTPYKTYIDRVRKIEKEYMDSGSDLMQHAFMRLRFGVDNAPQDQKENVDKAYEKLVEELTREKGHVPFLIKREIGMRAVICALCSLRRDLNKLRLDCGKTRMPLDRFVEIFIPVLNMVYNSGIFEVQASEPKFQGSKQLKVLTYIVFSAGGDIINYRIEDAEDAFGALLKLLIAKYAHDKKIQYKNEKIISEDDVVYLWADIRQILSKTILKEIRKAVRAEMKDTFNGTVSQFNKALKKESETRTEKQLNYIAKYLSVPKDV